MGTLDNIREWFRKPDEVIWDKQADMNSDYLESQRQQVQRFNQLSHLGIDEYTVIGLGTRSREQAQAEVRDHQWMLDRGEKCPNNPHNGGSRDREDGTWVDRRGPDWRYVEDQRELEALEAQVDPLTGPEQQQLSKAFEHDRTDELER
jgi:hypothetical protein